MGRKMLNWLSAILFMGCFIIFITRNWMSGMSTDTEGPLIEIDRERLEISVNDDSDVLLRGVTAYDDKDGNVTASLVVESVSDFTEDMVRYVNYAAFDRSNHVTKAHREIVYVDYTPIRFSLDAPMRFSMSGSSTDLLENITVTDCLDGDLTDQITFSGSSSVGIGTSGDYSVELQVINSAGDVARLPLTVMVYDYSQERNTPLIVLTDYLVYTSVGSALDPYSYLESVEYGGISYRLTWEETGLFGTDTSEMTYEERNAYQEAMAADPTVAYNLIGISDDVDYNTPGVYEIEYTLEDLQSNQGKMILTVVVEG